MNTAENALLFIHVFSCWFMTGVIWLVQVLVYPIFKHIGEKEFNLIHEFQMRRISWVVVPMMILELVTGGILYVQWSGSVYFWNLISVVSLWIFTGLVNVPTHNRLNFQIDASQVNLVTRNWPRTILWSARALFLLSLLMSS